MDDTKREWRALQLQVIKADGENEANCKEFQVVTNTIKEVIVGNNRKFAEDYKVIHAHIDHKGDDHIILKRWVKELKGIVWLQRTIINSCHDETAALGETAEQLVVAVMKLEGSVCCCHNWLMSPGPHFTEGENKEVVVDLEEDDDEEDGLKYETEEDPSDPSYMTPPSTGGCSPPSPHPSCSLTPEGSNPENNAHLQMVLIEAQVEAFLEEVDKGLKLADLPPLENMMPIPIQALTILGFIPFAMSTGQHCVPSKRLPHGVFHPYHNSIRQCHCEPGGWCNNLPCAGWKQQVLNFKWWKAERVVEEAPAQDPVGEMDCFGDFIAK